MITSVTAWNVRQPSGTRSWAAVRLATSDGLEGWGECRPLTSPDFASLTQLLKNQQESAFEALRVKLAAHPASAAVNIAALDIQARKAKAPLYQFLGGPTRHKVRAFTALYGASDDELLRALHEARTRGYKAFSVPAPQPPFRNSGRAMVLAATRRMDALRKAAGEDCDFVLSAAGTLTPGDAATLASVFEHEHLLWFDEPCSTASLGPVRKISEENVTPIGFGASATQASYFQNLLREDAIDVVRPELALHGISGIRKIAALAETYYIAVAPRHAEGPINTAAALHLAASLPNFFIQHIPSPPGAPDREMRAAIAGPTIESVRDGFASLSTQPGLGITVNRQAIERFGSLIQ